MAQFALRWILMFDAVTCAIPGGKRPSQVRDNCAASESAGAIGRGDGGDSQEIYDTKIRGAVHQRW